MRSTVPRLPLSLPVVTMTSSPFLIFSMFLSVVLSEHFRRKRDDLHDTLAAQLARHRPEDTRAERLQFRREEHRGVRVEPDAAAVRATHAEGRTYHHGVVDLAFLHAAARRGLLDAHPDHVADVGVAAFRAAK